ncbi:hypothetical protein M422DRAFT_270483 [Sphaerobolus stellatus SS14]|uniref:Uncharacterized protein n=1 Tax=Sphaerobolus stellatus (strain SS14) TaxID=990650 RepID=A0A0C9USB7_SPHS4|nr:hypothetical protein M422DRAFT_270483 [Sphaerobolus stellatus SS14]
MAPHSRQRVQRCFPPVSDRLSFSPERSVSPSPITLTRVFPASRDSTPFVESESSRDEVEDAPSSESPEDIPFTTSLKPRSRPADQSTTPSQYLNLVNKRVRIQSLPEILTPRRSTPRKTQHRKSMPRSPTPATQDVDNSASENEEGRIPKPKGEVGHPGTHGYSLFPTLRWEKALYEAVQKIVQKYADAKLDNTLGISKQDESLVLDVLRKVSESHPILNKYVDYWPARDMLKQYLKNTSEKSRREERVAAQLNS